MHNKLSCTLALALLILFVLGCKNLTGSRSEPPTSSNSSSDPKVRSDSDKIKELEAKANDLGALNAPVKLDPKARIKGKVALVTVSADGSAKIDGFYEDKLYDNGIVDYGFSKDEVAASTDEIDDLIQIKCSRGQPIGKYHVTDGTDIPAYELKCDVNVIDYKAQTVFARKSFVSSKLDQEISVEKSRTEKIAFVPRRAISDFLDDLRH